MLKDKGAAAPQFPRNEEEARPIFGITRLLSGVLGGEAMQEIASRHPTVRFQGNEYLLIGDLDSGGPLATREQYTAGECSFAHLFPDGRILRFGEQIGTQADLVFCEGNAPQAPPAIASDSTAPDNEGDDP